MSQTLNHDPAYWRSDAAAERGFDEPPVHPDYLTAATLGITVEDLSEKGGYFLRPHRRPVPHRTGLYGHRTPRRERGRQPRDLEFPTRVRHRLLAHPRQGRRNWRRALFVRADEHDPRREPMATDGSGERTDGSRSSSELRSDGGAATAEDDGDDGPELPEEFIAPEGGYFEDFVDALEEADDENAAVAYRHERGRTQDDVTVASLPLSTLNTAKQHHNVDVMSDSPSGSIVTYGDVTRSTALGHARSDEETWREVGFDDESFHVRRRRRHRLRLHACSRSRRRRLERGGGNGHLRTHRVQPGRRTRLLRNPNRGDSKAF